MRTLIIGLSAAIALTAAAVAIAAPGQRAPTSIELVAVAHECGGADLPPADGSPGDIDMCRGHLERLGSGGVVGRAAWFCPYTGAERFGSVCTAVASLPSGDLTFAGRLSHTSARSTWAVTGGTRRWAGARGSIALKQIDDTHTALTIRLAR